MSERLKHWITSIIGILMIIADGLFIYLDKVTIWQSLPLFVLGWVFLMAKNSLLEGITLGLLKIKKE